MVEMLLELRSRILMAPLTKFVDFSLSKFCSSRERHWDRLRVLAVKEQWRSDSHIRYIDAMKRFGRTKMQSKQNLAWEVKNPNQ